MMHIWSVFDEDLLYLILALVYRCVSDDVYGHEQVDDQFVPSPSFREQQTRNSILGVV